MASKSAAKRTLRIVSKCTTKAEFVAVFGRLCDDASIFIATSAPKAQGSEVRFNITLSDNTTMLAGAGKVTASHRDRDNRWGRAGMRIEFTELAQDSQQVLDLLNAAPPPPPANEQRPRKKRSTADLPPPVRGSGPRLLPNKPIVVPQHVPPVDGGWGGDDEDEDTEVGAAPIAPTVSAPDQPGEAQAAPIEERAKGSDYVLPANPFGELAPEMLEAFVECTLYEDTGTVVLDDHAGQAEGTEVAEPAEPAEQPHWWGTSEEMPAVDLTPETAPPDDVIDEDLRAMTEAAVGHEPAPPVARADSAPTSAPAAPTTPMQASNTGPAPPGPWNQPRASTPQPQPPPGPWGGPTQPRPATPLPVQSAPAVQASAPVPHPGPPSPAAPQPGSRAPMPQGATGMTGAPVPQSPQARHYVPPHRPPTPTDLVALRTRSRRSTVLVAIGAVAATLVIGYLIWGGSDDDGTEVAASASDDRPINRANKNKNEGEDEDKDEGKAEDKAATNGDDGKAEPAEDGPESGDNTASDDEPETGDGEPADTGDPVDGDGSGDGDGDGSGNNGDEPATDPAGEEKTPTTAPIAAGECAIEVTSKPAGAAILLGRKKLGVTPSTVSVACDTTELTLKRSRYALAKTKIAPTSGQTARVEVRLQRPTFALRVSSRPKATLYVGGRRVGSTPRTVKIRGYERTKVKLARKGYKTWSKRIYVKKKRYSLRVRLKRKR